MLRITILFACLVLALPAALAQESPLPHSREPLSDAWFTGPMLAPSANTLPRGHFLIEPYLFDVTTQGFYDRNHVRRSTTHSNGFGSLTYMLYGLANRLSVGLIPTAGYDTITNGPSSSGAKMGDVTIQGQYRFTSFQEGRHIPLISVALQQSFPTGRYDHLAGRPTNGMGSGTYTTTVALYSQEPFWLPNGRILRVRFNISQSFSREVNVKDASVYGTSDGFRGHATPGNTTFVDASWEYSATRRWVLALDTTYRHADNTRVTGHDVLDPVNPLIQLDSGSSEAIGFAPAIEYSWKSTIGVLLGARFIPAGRNTTASITPAVAINYVH